MSKPFPGMDPYLEGYLWPDLHNALAGQIRRQLMPLLRPRYVARLDVRMIADESPDGEIGIMYPDVEVMQSRAYAPPPFQQTDGVAVMDRPQITPAPITVSYPEVRIAAVEVRDVKENRLVTSIEIISPVNKRGRNRTQFLEKQNRLRRSGVHLLEIDLIRRGKRIDRRSLPKSAYLMTLIRAYSEVADLWPVQLWEALPVLPVPLDDPDEDVPLDLGAAVATVYTEAAYDLSINYTELPPPPELNDTEAKWVREILNDES